MKRTHKGIFAGKRNKQAGMTLVETMIALGIMLTVATGMMGLAAISVNTTETQGHLAARTTEYAQDKMEQLLSLKFCDGGTAGNTGTDTTVFPATTGTGTGLAGCSNMTTGVPQAGGSLSTTAPTAGYVDYLDASGNLVTATGNWEYERVWQITVPAGTTFLKQVTVLAQARYAAGGKGYAPTSTVSALKTYPF